MGSIGWVVVGVTAWMAVSGPAALLLGVLLRAGAARPVRRRGASRLRVPPCTRHRLPVA